MEVNVLQKKKGMTNKFCHPHVLSILWLDKIIFQQLLS